MKIKTELSTIEVVKTFVAGRDQVKIEDELVFDGRFAHGQIIEAQHNGIQYQIKLAVSKFPDVKTFHVTASRGGEVLHDEMYDDRGTPVGELGTSLGSMKFCGMAGAFVGTFVMTSIFRGSGVMGGAISGGIGGGLGGLLGC